MSAAGRRATLGAMAAEESYPKLISLAVHELHLVRELPRAADRLADAPHALRV